MQNSDHYVKKIISVLSWSIYTLARFFGVVIRHLNPPCSQEVWLQQKSSHVKGKIVIWINRPIIILKIGFVFKWAVFLFKFSLMKSRCQDGSTAVFLFWIGALRRMIQWNIQDSTKKNRPWNRQPKKSPMPSQQEQECQSVSTIFPKPNVDTNNGSNRHRVLAVLPASEHLVVEWTPSAGCVRWPFFSGHLRLSRKRGGASKTVEQRYGWW